MFEWGCWKKSVGMLGVFLAFFVFCECESLGVQQHDPPSFDEIVSEQAVLYVRVNDLPSTLNNLSATVFEPRYSEALKAKKLRTLEFPGIKYFASLESKSEFEWLPDLLTSLKTLDQQLPDHEPSIGTLAKLFSGELCFAVDRWNDQYFFVARFACNAEGFDWNSEFEAITEGKPNRREILGTTIFNLEPRMDVFVSSGFVHVVAGWKEGNDAYLNRLLTRIAGEDLEFTPLSMARWFIRCQKSLSRNRNFDRAETSSVACRIKDLFDLLDEPPGFRKQKDRFPDFADAFGGLVTLGDGDNHFTYQSVYTLVSPLPPDVKAALDSLNGLDLSKTRSIPADAALVSFASYQPSVAINKLLNATFWAGDEINMWVWKQLTDPALPSNKRDQFFRKPSEAVTPLVRIIEATGQAEISRVRYYLGESDQDFLLVDAILCDKEPDSLSAESLKGCEVFHTSIGCLLINKSSLNDEELPKNWVATLNSGDLHHRSFNFEEQSGMRLGTRGKVVSIAVATEEAYYASRWPPFLPITFFCDLFCSHWKKSYLYRERRQRNGTNPFWLEGHYDYSERTFFTKSMQVALVAFADLGDAGLLNQRKNSPSVVADAMLVDREIIEFFGAHFSLAGGNSKD